MVFVSLAQLHECFTLHLRGLRAVFVLLYGTLSKFEHLLKLSGSDCSVSHRPLSGHVSRGGYDQGGGFSVKFALLRVKTSLSNFIMIATYSSQFLQLDLGLLEFICVNKTFHFLNLPLNLG